MKPSLVIMAAGIGSRYGGLKQIDPVGPSGEIVLDYSVYDAIRAGFGKAVFIIRPDIETVFREMIGSKLDGKIEVEYLFQTLDRIPAGFTVPEGRTKPWGTGQAVLMARPVIREPFAIINADDFYGRGSFQALARQLSSLDPGSPDGCMVGFDIKNTLSPCGSVARGWCDVHNGKLRHIAERFKIERHADGLIRYEEAGALKIMEENARVSMNTWGFTPRLFDFLEQGFVRFLERAGGELTSEYLLPELIDGMIKNGDTEVTVLPTEDPWMGVTYAEDKPRVMSGIRALVKSGVYPGNLWN